MKDEKFCFKKSTGFIALVGILLVGFVLFAQMSNTSKSTDTKASGGTGTQLINGVLYGRTQNDCFMASKCAFSLASAVAGYNYKCVSVGSCVGKDSNGTSIDLFCISEKSPDYASNGTYEYKLQAAPTGVNCMPQATPDPAADPKCTDVAGGKGNWYRTTQYTQCNDNTVVTSLTAQSGTKYVAKTPITDSRTGYICCKPEAEPTLTVPEKEAKLTEAAKKSARNNNMCFRPSVGATCDAVSATMKAPFAPIDATDPAYKADCGTTAPLACKPVKNLCYGNVYFKSGSTTYQVTGTYPNTFIMSGGKVVCKVAAVTALATGQKVNTANRNICRDMNAAGFMTTADGGTTMSSVVSATPDADGYCTY